MFKRALVLSAMLLAGTCMSASSRTWHITPDGAGDAPTIQAGIDSATTGDEVVLANGVFTGDGNRDMDTGGKAVVVRSESGDPDSCIIDCQGRSRGRGHPRRRCELRGHRLPVHRQPRV